MKGYGHWTSKSSRNCLLTGGGSSAGCSGADCKLSIIQLFDLVCCRRLRRSATEWTTAYHVGSRRRHLFLLLLHFIVVIIIIRPTVYCSVKNREINNCVALALALCLVPTMWGFKALTILPSFLPSSFALFSLQILSFVHITRNTSFLF